MHGLCAGLHVHTLLHNARHAIFKQHCRKHTSLQPDLRARLLPHADLAGQTATTESCTICASKGWQHFRIRTTAHHLAPMPPQLARSNSARARPHTYTLCAARPLACGLCPSAPALHPAKYAAARLGAASAHRCLSSPGGPVLQGPELTALHAASPRAVLRMQGARTAGG